MPAYCIILRHRLECLRTIVVQCRSPSPGLMTLKEVFITPYGRLRSGWRVLIFVFVYICLLFVLSAASRVAYALALMLAPGRVAGVFASRAGCAIFSSAHSSVLLHCRWPLRSPLRAVE